MVAGWDTLLKNNLTTAAQISQNQVPYGLVNVSVFNTTNGASGLISLNNYGQRVSAVAQFINKDFNRSTSSWSLIMKQITTYKTDNYSFDIIDYMQPLSPNQTQASSYAALLRAGSIPGDYPVNVVNPLSSDVQWARIIGYIGVALCVVLFVFVVANYRSKSVAIYGLVNTASALLGCALGFSLPIVQNPLPDAANCILSECWGVISLTLCLCPVTFKALVHYFRKNSNLAKKKPVPGYHILLFLMAVLALQAIFLGSNLQQYPGISITQLDDVNRILTCEPSGAVLVVTFICDYIINIILTFSGLALCLKSTTDEKFSELRYFILLLGSVVFWMVAYFGISLVPGLYQYQFHIIAGRQFAVFSSILVLAFMPVVLSIIRKDTSLLIGGHDANGPSSSSKITSRVIAHSPQKKKPEEIEVKAKLLDKVELWILEGKLGSRWRKLGNYSLLLLERGNMFMGHINSEQKVDQRLVCIRGTRIEFDKVENKQSEHLLCTIRTSYETLRLNLKTGFGIEFYDYCSADSSISITGSPPIDNAEESHD
ncbi:uncharacterized protein BJ171DRAFT_280430 [Polychytrium aggregatum]|uniref:uncharacterized protein n=1 Tax=Polychytrium aggregatum TaxID=110093 RepID=UPI0022FE2BAA|nr:uncharacterized protein BJ171DRAFT_280430 [Polychytrium aggregatum]KAI9207718.1 hypothetical protein BJ171DRAFT_280430 [Polychytrium aggregatum]